MIITFSLLLELGFCTVCVNGCSTGMYDRLQEYFHAYSIIWTDRSVSLS